jgi:hypothetical protein
MIPDPAIRHSFVTAQRNGVASCNALGVFTSGFQVLDNTAKTRSRKNFSPRMQFPWRCWHAICNRSQRMSELCESVTASFPGQIQIRFGSHSAMKKPFSHPLNQAKEKK